MHRHRRKLPGDGLLQRVDHPLGHAVDVFGLAEDHHRVGQRLGHGIHVELVGLRQPRPGRPKAHPAAAARRPPRAARHGPGLPAAGGKAVDRIGDGLGVGLAQHEHAELPLLLGRRLDVDRRQHRLDEVERLLAADHDHAVGPRIGHSGERIEPHVAAVALPFERPLGHDELAQGVLDRVHHDLGVGILKRVAADLDLLAGMIQQRHDARDLLEHRIAGPHQQLARVLVAEDHQPPRRLGHRRPAPPAAALCRRRRAAEHLAQLVGQLLGIGILDVDLADVAAGQPVELLDLLEHQRPPVRRPPDEDRVGHRLGGDAQLAAGRRRGPATPPSAATGGRAGKDRLDGLGDAGRVAELTRVQLGLGHRALDIEHPDLLFDDRHVLAVAGVDQRVAARIAGDAHRPQISRVRPPAAATAGGGGEDLLQQRQHVLDLRLLEHIVPDHRDIVPLELLQHAEHVLDDLHHVRRGRDEDRVGHAVGHDLHRLDLGRDARRAQRDHLLLENLHELGLRVAPGGATHRQPRRPRPRADPQHRLDVVRRLAGVEVAKLKHLHIHLRRRDVQLTQKLADLRQLRLVALDDQVVVARVGRDADRRRAARRATRGPRRTAADHPADLLEQPARGPGLTAPLLPARPGLLTPALLRLLGQAHLRHAHLPGVEHDVQNAGRGVHVAIAEVEDADHLAHAEVFLKQVDRVFKLLDPRPRTADRDPPVRQHRDPHRLALNRRLAARRLAGGLLTPTSRLRRGRLTGRLHLPRRGGQLRRREERVHACGDRLLRLLRCLRLSAGRHFVRAPELFNDRRPAGLAAGSLLDHQIGILGLQQRHQPGQLGLGADEAVGHLDPRRPVELADQPLDPRKLRRPADHLDVLPEHVRIDRRTAPLGRREELRHVVGDIERIAAIDLDEVDVPVAQRDALALGRRRRVELLDERLDLPHLPPAGGHHQLVLILIRRDGHVVGRVPPRRREKLRQRVGYIHRVGVLQPEHLKLRHRVAVGLQIADELLDLRHVLRQAADQDAVAAGIGRHRHPLGRAAATSRTAAQRLVDRPGKLHRISPLQPHDLHDLTRVHVLIDHLDQLSRKLLILRRREDEQPVRIGIGHHRRALLHVAPADLPLALRDLGPQHLIDAALHGLGPGVLEHIRLHDGLIGLHRLDLLDQRVDEGDLIRRRQHDQRVRRRLSKRPGLHLPAARHAALAAQEELHLHRDLRRVEHLQRIQLDLNPAGVLRVDPRDELLDLLELLRRGLDDQRVVADGHVDLLRLRLPPPPPAVAEHVVDHVPHFPRIGVLQRDRHDAGVLDLDVQLFDDLAHLGQDRLGREDDQPVRPRVGADAEVLRAPPAGGHAALLHQIADGVDDLRRIDVLELEELRPGLGDLHQRLELVHHLLDLVELIRPGRDDQRLGRRVGRDRDPRLPAGPLTVERGLELAGEVVDPRPQTGQRVGPHLGLVRPDLIELGDQLGDLLHLVRRGLGDDAPPADHVEADLHPPAPPGHARLGKRVVQNVAHFPRVGVLELENPRRNDRLGGRLVELRHPLADLGHVLLTSRDDQRVGHRLDAELELARPDLGLKHPAEGLIDRVRIRVEQGDRLDLQRLVEILELLHRPLDFGDLLLRRRDDQRVRRRQGRDAHRRLAAVALGVDGPFDLPGELVELRPQPGQPVAAHHHLVLADRIELGRQLLNLLELVGRGLHHQRPARDDTDLDLLARRQPPPVAALHERRLEDVVHLPRVGVLQLDDDRLADRLGRLGVELLGPLLDVSHVLLVAADDQRVGQRLSADLERAGPDLLVEDRPQNAEHRVRVGVLERNRVQLALGRRLLVQLGHERLGHLDRELGRIDDHAVQPRIDRDVHPPGHIPPAPAADPHVENVAELAGDVVRIGVLDLDELLLGRHALGLGHELGDQLVDLLERVLRRRDDQHLGQPVVAEGRPQPVRPLAVALLKGPVELVGQIRHVEPGQLARLGHHRRDVRQLLLRHVVLLQQRDRRLHGHLRRTDDHPVGPRIGRHAHLLGRLPPELLAHHRHQLIAQPAGDLVRIGVLKLIELGLVHQPLADRAILLQQLLGLVLHLLADRHQNALGAGVGLEAGDHPLLPHAITKRVAQPGGDRTHIRPRHLDQQRRDATVAQRIELLDQCRDLGLLARGRIDHDLIAHDHRLDLRAYRPAATPPPDRRPEKLLNRLHHIPRRSILERVIPPLGLLSRDLRVHLPGEVLDPLDRQFVRLDDQRVGHRLGVHGIARAGPPAAPRRRQQPGRHLRHLRRVGVLERNDHQRRALDLAIEHRNQGLDLLHRRPHRLHHHLVALGGDKRRLAAQHRVRIAAVKLHQRLGDLLGIAVFDLEELQLRLAADGVLVPQLDRRLDLFPLLIRAVHDQQVRLVQRNHLRRRSRPPAPAAEARARRGRAAAEQRLHHLRGPAGQQVRKLDHVLLLLGRGRVQIGDDLGDAVHRLAVGDHVQRIAGRIDHHRRPPGADRPPAHLRSDTAGDLLDDRLDLLGPGMLELERAEVARHRLVDDFEHLLDALEPVLVGIDDQRVGPLVRHEQHRLLCPLVDVLDDDVLRRGLGRGAGGPRRPPPCRPREARRKAARRLPLLLLKDLVQQISNLAGVAVLDLDHVRLELAQIGLLVERLDELLDLIQLLRRALDDQRVRPLVRNDLDLALRIDRLHPPRLRVVATLRLTGPEQLAHHPLDLARIGADVEDPHLARIELARHRHVQQLLEPPYVLRQSRQPDHVRVVDHHRQRPVRHARGEHVHDLLRRTIRDREAHTGKLHVAQMGLLERLVAVEEVLQRQQLRQLAQRNDIDVVLRLHHEEALLDEQEVQLVDGFLLGEAPRRLVGQLPPDDHIARHQRLADPLGKVLDHLLPRHVHEVEPLRPAVRRRRGRFDLRHTRPSRRGRPRRRSRTARLRALRLGAGRLGLRLRGLGLAPGGTLTRPPAQLLEPLEPPLALLLPVQRRLRSRRRRRGRLANPRRPRRLRRRALRHRWRILATPRRGRQQQHADRDQDHPSPTREKLRAHRLGPHSENIASGGCRARPPAAHSGPADNPPALAPECYTPIRRAGNGPIVPPPVIRFGSFAPPDDR